MGCGKNSAKRDVYSCKCVHVKGRKISNQQPNFTPQD